MYVSSTGSSAYRLAAAGAAVVAGALVDILLGIFTIIRRWSRFALLGMIATTLAYLAAASALRPDLWLDPLGPLVKTVPAAILALTALAFQDER